MTNFQFWMIYGMLALIAANTDTGRAGILFTLVSLMASGMAMLFSIKG